MSDYQHKHDLQKSGYATVGELIEKLKGFDPEIRIIVKRDGMYDGLDIDSVFVTDIKDYQPEYEGKVVLID